MACPVPSSPLPFSSQASGNAGMVLHSVHGKGYSWGASLIQSFSQETFPEHLLWAGMALAHCWSWVESGLEKLGGGCVSRQAGPLACVLGLWVGLALQLTLTWVLCASVLLSSTSSLCHLKSSNIY